MTDRDWHAIADRFFELPMPIYLATFVLLWFAGAAILVAVIGTLIISWSTSPLIGAVVTAVAAWFGPIRFFRYVWRRVSEDSPC